MDIKKSELQQLLKVIKVTNFSIPEVINLIWDKSATYERLRASEEISLTVDYSHTLEQMIVAGKYDWKDINIMEKHFPLPAELFGKKTTVSGKLFHFNRNISTVDAMAGIDKAGYRPATLPEILALGAKHPELQHQFLIIALGSVWRSSLGRYGVPCLGVGGNGRRLNLYWLDYVWLSIHCFLGFRK